MILYLYETLLEAIFPVSRAEAEALSINPVDVFEAFTKSPPMPIEDSDAVFAYKDELVKAVVLAIKDKRDDRALSIAGYSLAKKMKQITSRNFSETMIFIPIPSTTRKLKERGYNQCELITESLIRELKKIDECESENIFMMNKEILIRYQDSGKQALRNRKERIESAKEIFKINKDRLRELFERIKKRTDITTKIKSATSVKITNQYSDDYGEGVTFIVIDDVITTGSTMKAALGVLSKALNDVRAGNENSEATQQIKVYGLVLAH